MDDYKKYSLEQLDNWIHDAISCSEATPQEIYDTIKKAVEEEYYTYKHRTGQAYELLALLNGNTVMDAKGNQVPYDNNKSRGAWDDYWEYGDPPMRVNSEGEAWIPDYFNTKKDKVKKWALPVEVDGLSGECFVNLPDDLLEAAGMKEGDQITWMDNGDGSFSFSKIKTHDEMIADGWTMTADGFWIKEN